MMHLSFRFVILVSLFAVCSSFAQPALAQNRNLPKANFPTFFNHGTGNTAPSMGMHLTPGLDRPGNAPAQVYPPGEPSQNGGLVRWEAKKMPLHIWISPGLKLPEKPFEEAQATRVGEVFDMLCSPQQDPFVGLKTAMDWTPQTNEVVASGFEMWRRFQDEGLVSFDFVDDPRNARILVFFTDSFHDSNSPGGTSVAGNTSAEIFSYSQAQQINIAQKPVVIELSTTINSSDGRMRAAAAHEFGHALGIKAHSPYRDDLMYVDRIVEQLSPSDVATFRWLYHQVPQWVY